MRRGHRPEVGASGEQLDGLIGREWQARCGLWEGIEARPAHPMQLMARVGTKGEDA